MPATIRLTLAFLLAAGPAMGQIAPSAKPRPAKKAEAAQPAADPAGSTLAALQSPAAAPAEAAAPGQASVVVTPARAPSEERQELDKLSAENSLVAQEVAKKLRAVIAEKEELRIKSELQAEKNKADLAKLDAEFQRLSLENRLQEEQNKKLIEALTTQQKKVSAENALDEERHKQELSDLRQAKEKLQAANDKLREELRAEEMKNQAEKQNLDLEGARLGIESMRMKSEREKLEDKLAKLKTDIESRAKQDEWKNEANKDPVILKEPFKEGVLTISDRRITLNGVIMRGVADYVSERLDFFNNVSADPVFIVIDRCPGGSVMEGYRIVKAVEASKAPVHVVVTSFAASMCAVITTLAPHSYVYPNAIVLHHQMSTVLWGNMTQTKEQLAMAGEWWRRLADPVAKKMGTDLEGLVKKMYAKNSDGDWEEFGDRAVALRWADRVVDEIRETGVKKRPDDEKSPNPGLRPFALDEKTDEKGERYVRLPRLDPFDLYWIYNPDRYYR